MHKHSHSHYNQVNIYSFDYSLSFDVRKKLQATFFMWHKLPNQEHNLQSCISYFETFINQSLSFFFLLKISLIMGPYYFYAIF